MKRLLIAGGVVFFLSLLLHIPAQLGLSLFAPEGLAMKGVSGTIWSGRAAEASYQRTYLGEVSWRFRPLSLLMARAGFHVTSRSPNGNFDAAFARGLGGALRIDAVNGRTRLSTLSPALPPALPVGNFDASLDIDLTDVIVVEGWPHRARGMLRIVGLEMRGFQGGLGNYEVRLYDAESGDAIAGEFNDLDGPLDIEGSLELTPDGNYSMNCSATARPDAPGGIAMAADLICPAG